MLLGVPTVLAGVPTMLAGVPTVLAGVPTMLAGVPTVLAGVPTVLAGVPPRGVLLGAELGELGLHRVGDEARALALEAVLVPHAGDPCGDALACCTQVMHSGDALRLCTLQVMHSDVMR